MTVARDYASRDCGESLARAYPAICRFIETHLGISMDRGLSRGAIEQFIKRKMQELGISTDAAFAEILAQAREGLLKELIDAVTVPYSWLFRDYEQLRDAALALDVSPRPRRELQIWVPACAGGEDAYSLAAILQAEGKRARILASDISVRAVRRARSGEFGTFATREIPERHRHQMERSKGGTWTFVGEVASQIGAIEHNLVDAPPISTHSHGGWDLILCRNVLIYFAREPAQQVLAQLGHALAPDGLLVLGASDIVLESPVGLEPTSLNGRLAFRLGRGSLAKNVATLAEKRQPEAAESRLLAEEIQKCGRAGDGTHATVGRPEAGSFLSPAVGDDSSAGTAASALRNDRDVRSDDEDLSAQAVDDMLDGIAQYLAGHSSEAVKALRAALFHCPSLWPAAYYLALCCEELGRYREARREYQRTIDLINRRAPLPEAAHQDYSFLELDILGLAKQRIALTAR